MNSDPATLWKAFEEHFTQPERDELAKTLLDASLLEVVCAECGRYALTLRRGQLSGAFECPACHKRTFALLNEGRYNVFSETRLIRLIRYVSAKRWYCPEHDGVPLKVVRVQGNPDDPRMAILHYVCRRGHWPFSRKRLHSGQIPINLLTLEMEMLSR
jgi:hypothetical protein